MNDNQLLRKNFESELLSDDVVDYFLSKTKEEVEQKYGEKVSRMIGFEQKNMHHCYDLWGHTLHTVESIDTTFLNEEQTIKLKVAAFFHDIGKPDVVGYNPRTKQQNFYNHAVHSVTIAKPILEKLGYNVEEIEQICFYILHHDDFISYKLSLALNQKTHVFLREVNVNSVAEIVTQNQYNFDKLGYPIYLPTHTENEEINEINNNINNDNKLKIRYVCFALNNGGISPKFTNFKGEPIKVNIDLNEVKSKMRSGEYAAHYIPSLEDYKLLLELCKADAKAQSEVVLQDGIEVDSRKRKLETFAKIEQVLFESYKMVEERDN